MTAVNVFASAEAGYLSADAAVWNPDGTLREVFGKIIVCKKAKTAVAARGIFSQGLLQLTLRGCQTFEAVIEASLTFAHGNEARVAKDRAWAGWTGEIEMYGVSWRDSAPFAWWVSSDRPDPLQVIGLRYSPDVDLSVALGREVASSAAFSALDPREAFLDLMQGQRRRVIETTAGGMHCVGGRCDLATVTEAGVTVETLLHWPDRTGERIRP